MKSLFAPVESSCDACLLATCSSAKCWMQQSSAAMFTLTRSGESMRNR